MITRRTLLQSTLSATALGAMHPLFAASAKRKFKLKFAPHLGQFVGHKAGERACIESYVAMEAGF